MNQVKKFVESVEAADASKPTIEIETDVAIAAKEFIKKRLEASARGGVKTGSGPKIKLNTPAAASQRERTAKSRANAKLKEKK